MKTEFHSITVHHPFTEYGLQNIIVPGSDEYQRFRNLLSDRQNNHVLRFIDQNGNFVGVSRLRNVEYKSSFSELTLPAIRTNYHSNTKEELVRNLQLDYKKNKIEDHDLSIVWFIVT